jgi:hypothetical protein
MKYKNTLADIKQTAEAKLKLKCRFTQAVKAYKTAPTAV